MSRVEMDFSSFTEVEKSHGFLSRPHRVSELERQLNVPGAAIPRAGGLSYTLASASESGSSFVSDELNRFLDWPGSEHTVSLEPGVQLGDLLEQAVRRGQWFPVLPGYPQIRVGGAIGFDVHGKSQWHDGHFSDWVTSLELFHPQHGTLKCDPSLHSEIFDLTLGGMGLTGYVTRASLRLQPLEGSHLRQEKIRVGDLIEAVDVMREEGKRAKSVYSWHDLSNILFPFGSGFVFVEKVEGEPESALNSLRFNKHQLTKRSWVSVWPFLTSRACSVAFHLLNLLSSREKITPVLLGAFPLIGKEIYFQQFRRVGFFETQVIIPFEKWEAFVDDLKKVLRGNWRKYPVTMSSLKIFSGTRKLLKFRQEGVCFSMDLMATKSSVGLLARVDELVVKYDGLPNLAKDPRLPQWVAEKTYGEEYSKFRKQLIEFDSTRKFQSHMSQRLGL